MIINRYRDDDLALISIEKDGLTFISSQRKELIARARSIISSSISDLEIGMTVSEVATKVLPFGVYVAIADGKEG